MTSQDPDLKAGSGSPIGRRRAVVIVTIAVTAMAAMLPLARRLSAGLRQTRHRPLPPDRTPVDPGLLARMATLTGALFGHRLDARDTSDLGSDLALLVAQDGGWRAEFVEAADYVDRLARAAKAPSFANASDDVRDAIVDHIMRPSVATTRSSLLATISTNERVRRRMRAELIDRLTTVYRASSPAWHRRGYARTPGESGDPREYTRAGTPPAC